MVYVPSEFTLWSNSLSEQYWGAHVYHTTDTVATVRAANYISDAQARGVQVGDIVWVYVWDTTVRSGTLSAIQIMPVVAVTATGADLGDGTAISVTNT